jgi:glycosyltransferase involved in cell wall biosynthesis
MRVLALASYPEEAAATRYRLTQFVRPLSQRGITLQIRPFLDSRLFSHLYQRKAVGKTAAGLLKSAALRLLDLIKASNADVILVQREAMMFGPPFVEWFAHQACRRPLVLDLDDATYVSYTSPVYGSLGKSLKWFGKTDDLIRWASIVTCGNRAIAEYVESKGTKALIIPTVVDAELFRPAQRPAEAPPVLGWVGTHSTFPYLKSIFPALEQLAKENEFVLKVVGAGEDQWSLPGVKIENLEWNLHREIADFQSFDIGLYPIDASLYADEWAKGKSGFKAIQYMAVGIPFVASPVGTLAELGEPGVTHFLAETPEEWRNQLSTLLVDRDRRRQMGAAGRQHLLQNYSLTQQAEKLAAALQEALVSAKN